MMTRVSLICLVLLATSFYVVEPKTCRALALSGGGDKGAYQAGALKALIENLPAEETQYDVVSGVSIGAVNSIIISAYEKGQEAAMIEDLVNAWLSVKKQDLYRDWFPGGIVEGVIMKQSLFDDSPMEDFFKKLLQNKEFKRRMSFTATDANTGAYLRFNETTLATEGLDKFIGYLMGSVALPGLFSPTVEGNQTLIDGGVLINLDVEGAVKRCKEIVDSEADIVLDVILCTGKNLEEIDAENAHVIPMLMRYLSIHSYRQIMDDLIHQKFDHPKIKFRYIIAPTHKLSFSPLPINFKKGEIAKLIQEGIKDALAVISQDPHTAINQLFTEYKEFRKPKRYTKKQ